MAKPRDHRRIGLLFVECSLGLFIASVLLVALTQGVGNFTLLQGALLFTSGLVATWPLLKFYLSGQVRFAALYAACAGLGMAFTDWVAPVSGQRALWVDLGHSVGLILGATFFLFFILRTPLLRLLSAMPEPARVPAGQ